MSRLADEGSAFGWRPFEPCLESAKREAARRRIEEEGACPACEEIGECLSQCPYAGMPRAKVREAADDLARWHRER